MKRKNVVYIVTLILSFFLVVATLYIPTTYYSDNDLTNVKCGWPLTFIEGASWRNPPFPFHTPCIEAFYIFPRENPAEILWLPFVINTIIFSIPLFLIIKSANFLKRKHSNI